MAVRRIVVPRQYPPTMPVQPAGRWLERGLLRLWVPLWRNELITGAAPSNDSTTAQRSGFGPVRGVSNVAYGAWDDDYRTLIKNKLTWFLFAEYTSTTNSFTCGNLELAGSGYNHGLYVNSSGFPLFFVKTGGSGTLAAGTSTVANAGPALHGGSYDGANIRVFFKGRQEGSAAKTGNVDTTDFDTSLNRWYGNGHNAGVVYYFGVANQDWRPDEFAELAAAPWSILEESTVYAKVASAAPTFSAAWSRNRGQFVGTGVK